VIYLGILSFDAYNFNFGFASQKFLSNEFIRDL